MVLKEAIKCQATLNIVRHILTQFILKIKVSKENKMDHLHQRKKNRLSLILEYSANADAQRSWDKDGKEQRTLRSECSTKWPTWTWGLRHWVSHIREHNKQWLSCSRKTMWDPKQDSKHRCLLLKFPTGAGGASY